MSRIAADGAILVIDDFHWADEGSAEVVENLVRWPPEAPLLLVLAHRPRQTPRALRSALAHGQEMGSVESVVLDRLSLRQSADILGRSVHDAEMADLYADSDGNPLYLLALDRAARAGEWDGPAAGVRRDRTDPATLDRSTALLLRELVALPPTEYQVASAAAVLGDPFDAEAVAAVAEFSQERVAGALCRLVGRDLLRPDEGAPGLRFRHPVVRRAVHANMDLTERIAAHRRALALVEQRGGDAVSRAVHIQQSVSSPSAADRRVLLQAAEARMAEAPEAAIGWLRLALRGLPAKERRGSLGVEIQQLLARSLGMAGQLHKSQSLLREILTTLSDQSDDARLPLVALCGTVECLLGRYAVAESLLDAELESLGTRQVPEAAALLIVRGLVRLMSGGEAHEDAAAGLRIARRFGDTAAQAGALALQGFAWSFTYEISRAGEAVTAAASLCDGLLDSQLAAVPEYLVLLGWAESMLGRLTDAEQHVMRASALVDRTGCSYLRPLVLCCLSNVHRQRGKFAEAMSEAASAYEIAERSGSGHLAGLALAVQSQAALWVEASGRTAVALADRAVELLPPGSSVLSGSAALALAFAVALDGDAQRCQSLILAAGRGPELPGLPAVLHPLCTEVLTATAVSLGESGAEWAHRTALSAEALGLPVQEAFALAARGHELAAREGHFAAADCYRRAAAILAAADMMAPRARMLILAASSAARSGASKDAAALLALAKRLAAQCGAKRFYHEAEDAERRFVPPETAQAAEPAAVPDVLLLLTEREREVAVLAAGGARTKKIAQTLAVSPRTIEVHLRSIYTKLNVNSRVALSLLVGAS